MTDPRARILIVQAYLEKQTDERHPAAVQELVAHLERAGLAADRRTVYRDLALLRENGMKIAVRRGRRGGFFLEERLFEPGEVRILADMVRRNRVLSQARTDAILRKLGSLAGASAAPALTGGGQFCGERKVSGEDAFLNVGRICEAIDAGKRLSFVYRRDEACRRTAGCGAPALTVDPWLMICSNETYYLVAGRPLCDGFAHYRVDRMAKVCVLEETCAASRTVNPAEYERSVFGMEPGELRWVRLAFEKPLLGEMLDRFGAEAPVSEIDENTGSICAGVRVSPPFFGWVFHFDGRVRILAPDDVRETMTLMLENGRLAGKRGKAGTGANLES